MWCGICLQTDIISAIKKKADLRKMLCTWIIRVIDKTYLRRWCLIEIDLAQAPLSCHLFIIYHSLSSLVYKFSSNCLFRSSFSCGCSCVHVKICTLCFCSSAHVNLILTSAKKPKRVKFWFPYRTYNSLLEKCLFPSWGVSVSTHTSINTVLKS